MFLFVTAFPAMALWLPVQSARSAEQVQAAGTVDAKTGQPQALPKGNPGAWIGIADYPAAAKAANASGPVEFTVSVNDTGAVTGCTIRQSSGNADLDMATCELMRTRGRFAPALDAAGKPVAGSWSKRVNWAIAETPGVRTEWLASEFKRDAHDAHGASWFSQSDYPPESRLRDEEGRVTVTLDIDERGVPTKCRIAESSGYPVLDAKTCELALKRGRFKPATDTTGKPVASSFTLPAVRWSVR
ncbi:MAG: energy transducer TonB [Sphingomonas sp.]